MMEEAFELLKLILPAGVVFLTAYYTLKNFLDSESKKNLVEIRKAGQTVTAPIRLQAYERVVLFLERISPDNLVMRVHGDNPKTAKQLHTQLIQAIRDEYDHNISQQVYISDRAWDATLTAKNEMIKLVNLASTQMEEKSTGLDLSKTIFEMADQLEVLPTKVAIDIAKQEVKQIF